jgi:hypothetical protein
MRDACDVQSERRVYLRVREILALAEMQKIIDAEKSDLFGRNI